MLTNPHVRSSQNLESAAPLERGSTRHETARRIILWFVLNVSFWVMNIVPKVRTFGKKTRENYQVRAYHIPAYPYPTHS